MTKGALFITGMTVKTEALLTCHQDSEWKKDRMNGLVGLLGSHSNGISDPFCPCKIGRCVFVISGISVNWGNPANDAFQENHPSQYQRLDIPLWV